MQWAICEKFHEYLYGSTPFEVYTDNNPLTYVLTTAKLDACGQRWVAKLANYNFTIQYRSGQSNVEADALSRISWPKVLDGTDTVDVESMDTHIVNAIITVWTLANNFYRVSLFLRCSVAACICCPKCALLFWGIFVRGLRVETFVRVLRSSELSLNNCK